MKRLVRTAPVFLALSFFACATAEHLGSHDDADASIRPPVEADEDSERDAGATKDAAKEAGKATPSNAPAVILNVAPSLMTAAGEVKFTVNVTGPNPIEEVVIEQDGYEFATFTSLPYSGYLDVTAADNGSYSFTAKATDSANRVGLSKTANLMVAIPSTADASVPSTDAGPTDASSTDAADAKAPLGTNRVFVTAGTYTSNLKLEGNGSSGPDGADKLCNKEALTAGLGGTWKAWIRETGVGSGALRVGVHGPWARLDGMLVFPGTSVSGTPLVPINRTPLNQVITSNTAVYTALYNDGTSTSSDYDCDGWTSTLGYVNMGSCASTAGWSWSYYGVNYVCDQEQARLYCFEQ